MLAPRYQQKSCSTYFISDSFVLAGPDLWERDAVGSLFGGQSVQVNGQRKFGGQTTAKLFGALNAIVDGDTLS